MTGVPFNLALPYYHQTSVFQVLIDIYRVQDDVGTKTQRCVEKPHKARTEPTRRPGAGNLGDIPVKISCDYLCVICERRIEFPDIAGARALLWPEYR